MPELPEVETIVNDLRKVLPGLRFHELISSHDNTVAQALDRAHEIMDVAVKEVARRGKFIVIFFENERVMTIHLRMSGRILMRNFEEDALPFERTRIIFNGTTLRFCDVRKFGKVWISKLEDYEAETGINRLGVEPFSKDFDFEKFKNLLIKRKGAVKRWLLDQALIAGIGNIYADEACFYAGIKPEREVSTLNEEELKKLFKSVLKALKQGIRNRGTSISDFQDAYGKTGRNQELLYVYGRGGEKCLSCSGILKKTRVAGRGTVFCEVCQS